MVPCFWHCFGERFDAHQFVRKLSPMVLSAVVSRPLADVAIPQILVADTRVALGQISCMGA